MKVYQHELDGVFDRQTWFCGAFWGRVEGIKVEGERNEIIDNLRVIHDKSCFELLGEKWPLVTCEQVHGADVQLVDDGDESYFTGCDGLITRARKKWLGIYVADCAAVYVCDPVQQAVALLHSGKKGTEGQITARAIEQMVQELGSHPRDLQLVVSPCIRPPAYEVDFAAEIRQQALGAGVRQENYHDAGVCTYQDPEKFYSYRREKGRTGRMLAVLGIR
jgi:polyphenol oxidase